MNPTTTQQTWDLVAEQRRTREATASCWRLGRRARLGRRVA
jgi:hypothetical protein